jgi:Carbohydrate esterase, sialic acid-specific acetylesterase
MTHLIRLCAILALLLDMACSSLFPTPRRATDPIVLSGQSNALPDHLGDPFQAEYPATAVVAEGSQPISAWDVGRPLWAQLEPLLHRRHLRAFVWWQGESDAQLLVGDYEGHLRAFLHRVRHAAADPSLLIVVVQVLRYTPPAGSGLGDADGVRADQARYVASDPRSVLVSVDDLPRDPGNHLADAAAQRILAVIQTHAR